MAIEGLAIGTGLSQPRVVPLGLGLVPCLNSNWDCVLIESVLALPGIVPILLMTPIVDQDMAIEGLTIGIGLSQPRVAPHLGLGLVHFLSPNSNLNCMLIESVPTLARTVPTFLMTP